MFSTIIKQPFSRWPFFNWKAPALCTSQKSSHPQLNPALFSSEKCPFKWMIRFPKKKVSIPQVKDAFSTTKISSYPQVTGVPFFDSGLGQSWVWCQTAIDRPLAGVLWITPERSNLIPFRVYCSGKWFIQPVLPKGYSSLSWMRPNDDRFSTLVQ